MLDDRITYFESSLHETKCDLCKAPVHKGDICETTYSRKAFWLPPLVICGRCLEHKAEDYQPAVHRGCPVN